MLLTFEHEINKLFFSKRMGILHHLFTDLSPRSYEQCEDFYDYRNRDMVEDLQRTNDMRVLDYDGHHIFHSFSLKKIGRPFVHEE